MYNNCEKVLLIGGTGFVGKELGVHLAAHGIKINLLSRKTSAGSDLSYPADIFTWNQDSTIPASAMEGVSAIINLAGESIGDGRWTSRKKRAIQDSRSKSSTAAVNAANHFNIKTLIQASAIGFYGDCGPLEITENFPLGSGFLAETVGAWEEPVERLAPQFRSVILRLGVVMGTTGGAFLQMLDPYALGLGGMIGDGKGWFSWIHVKDVCRFIYQAIRDPQIQGVYNLTTPEPVRYEQLHLHLLPYFSGIAKLRVPRTFLQIALGEKSELLLMSQKVMPKRLEEINFSFQFASLATCLENLLGSQNRRCHIHHVKQWFPVPIDKVWDFFSDERNLEKITPPWLHFRIEHKSDATNQEGSQITYRLKVHGIPMRWQAKIINMHPPRSFEDIQISGPYTIWHHYHSFSSLGSGTLVEDKVRYRLPLGFLGGILGFFFVQRDVRKIFSYRQNALVKMF